MLNMKEKMIWIPNHPELGWAPGTVIEKGENGEYKVED